MVATQTQLRRGTSSQCDAMTPVEGEVIVDLTNDRLRLGDGLIMGGIPLPNAADAQMSAFNFGVAGGSANALTITLSPVPTYSQPLTIRFKATNTNTGATTINVNSIGTKNIWKWSNGSLVALVAGDIVTGGIYEIVYDGTQFQLMTLYNSGISTVRQADLNTSVSTFSGQTTTILTSLVGANQLRAGPGVISGAGEYGFDIQSYFSGGPRGGFWDGSDLLGGTYVSSKTAWSWGAINPFCYGSQRYVNSSPPFDMGDGEVGGFIFLLLNPSGEIVAHYASDVPPWGYNGPTKIRADHICPITKKKFRRVEKQKTFEELMDGAKSEYVLQEITNKIKNADMKLIPHPFPNKPKDHTVVMLDPMSDKVSRMMELQNNGHHNDVMEAIVHSIKIDNDGIKRSCPKSVKACKFTYKRK